MPSNARGTRRAKYVGRGPIPINCRTEYRGVVASRSLAEQNTWVVLPSLPHAEQNTWGVATPLIFSRTEYVVCGSILITSRAEYVGRGPLPSTCRTKFIRSLAPIPITCRAEYVGRGPSPSPAEQNTCSLVPPRSHAYQNTWGVAPCLLPSKTCGAWSHLY